MLKALVEKEDDLNKKMRTVSKEETHHKESNGSAKNEKRGTR